MRKLEEGSGDSNITTPENQYQKSQMGYAVSIQTRNSCDLEKINFFSNLFNRSK